ncbi:MAG: DUF6123 family protein [Bacillus sp. (in: firmicutes)]
MTVEQYIVHLESKGFAFNDAHKGFIFFGKEMTAAADHIAIVAIEITLKAQKRFDGSFYISLLEAFKENNVTTRKRAIQFAERNHLLR